ncbi:MAG TPA: MBL fold metallo-hydrolase [Candidatus Paceibacterota bacterium]
MKLSFYGAAGGEVTGSNHLLEVGEAKFLIDCGMFQGSEWHDRKNFEPFLYDPKEITAVFVTHAHVDHIGRIPKLIKDGFTGKIYSTAPTKDLAEQLLLDSAHILAGGAERFGTPALYGEAEIDRALAVWQTVRYDTPIILPELTITFYDAGHILGSSFILFEAEGKRLVFSGDLGNTPALLVRPTEHIKEADYCVMESTYGGRVHEAAGKRVEILLGIIKETIDRGGVLIVPAFAMERTQDLIFELNQLAEHHRIPKVPIFVDSPLAIKLTAIYKSYPMLFNDEVRKVIAGGDDIFVFNGLHFTPSSEESKAINNVPAPKIVIASSGMSEGGRIVHHERRYLSDPKNTILFVGYQPPTSLGWRIQNGEKIVRILGEDIHVRAKIYSLGSYSAHADEPRLLDWLKPMKNSLKKVFVIHGDPSERAALIQRIQDDFHLKTEAPDMDSTYDII